MKKLRILGGVFKRTGADRVLLSYLLFVFADALVILLVEPGIHRYGDALWYCYAVLSTAGFGDIVAATLVGKLCSVALTAYSLFALAILTAVVVNYFTQIIEIRQKNTLAAFMDRLERLPELTPEELEELSKNVHRFRDQL